MYLPTMRLAEKGGIVGTPSRVWGNFSLGYLWFQDVLENRVAVTIERDTHSQSKA